MWRLTVFIIGLSSMHYRFCVTVHQFLITIKTRCFKGKVRRWDIKIVLGKVNVEAKCFRTCKLCILNWNQSRNCVAESMLSHDYVRTIGSSLLLLSRQHNDLMIIVKTEVKSPIRGERDFFWQHFWENFISSERFRWNDKICHRYLAICPIAIIYWEDINKITAKMGFIQKIYI